MNIGFGVRVILLHIEARVHPLRGYFFLGAGGGRGWAMPRNSSAVVVVVAAALLAPDYQACTRLPCMHPTTLHAPDYLAWTRLPCMDPTTLLAPDYLAWTGLPCMDPNM